MISSPDETENVCESLCVCLMSRPSAPKSSPWMQDDARKLLLPAGVSGRRMCCTDRFKIFVGSFVVVDGKPRCSEPGKRKLFRKKPF